MTQFRAILIFLMVSVSTGAKGCFILFLSDGKQVLVGNHEDWFAKDAAIRINRPTPDKFGSVTFTFLSEGWAQGGMNERGLFFDAAHTPFQEIDFDQNLKRYQGNIWQFVLDKASTVEEALNLIKGFRLKDIEETHVMIADAEGNAALIGVDHGKVAIKRVSKSNLVQTNFNPWQPELSDEPVCWRYQKAQQQLKILPNATFENVKSILEQTHQDSLTVYSNIYDLKNKVIYTYNKRNFKKAIVVDLPEIFSRGDCIASLDSLEVSNDYWRNCTALSPTSLLVIKGKVIDQSTGQPIPYANIGIIDQNIGTLSDPDGSFEIIIPAQLKNEMLVFSSLGFDRRSVLIKSLLPQNNSINLTANSIVLESVTITAKQSRKTARLGCMGGKDGILPLDTVQGGGAVAMLIQAPASPASIEKLQVRLMYNSKETLQIRFHVYAFDSIRQIPGEELLATEVMLKETKRFGWLRFDLTSYHVDIDASKFFIAFEWIDDNSTRKKMLTGLREWEKWKKEQYEIHNAKVEQVIGTAGSGEQWMGYKYHGNMMDWPGFKSLPPFTGLMVETGKRYETKSLRTFERKTSFGEWKELNSTLNAVITVKY